jgi:hypothetical protein
MGTSQDPDPFVALRRADPVSPGDVPPASAARLRARVMEDTMDREPKLAPAPAGRRVPWPVLYGAGVAGLVVAIVAGTGLVPLGSGAPAVSVPPAPSSVAVAPTPAPTGGPVGGGAGGFGQCAFEFTPETLSAREWAFDGTVTAIAGNQGTFLVEHWYRGGPAETVARTIDGLTEADGLLGGPGLEVGGRYLVAGDDQFAWSCGFTQFWNADVAADWARAFRE